MANNFVHLHGHTEYSLLDGLSKVKKLIKKVKELDMPAVAITDHGGMFGAIEFYKEAVKVGVKPIIGCELYVARRSHKDKEGKLDTEPYHLTVMAKNHQGYLNLMKLVSVGYLDGYYYKPRVDRELLSQYSEGLIALSGCPAGEFIRSLKSGDLKDAEKVAKDYLKIFGEGNYFFELQNHQYDLLLKNPKLDPSVKRELERMGEVQNLTWGAVSGLSKKLGVRVVATNDFHYVDEGDSEAQDAVVCVQTGKFIKDINRLRMIDTPNLYLRSAPEM
ncbi:MAG: PHP domain-containing protein, partial [Candidatus Daviesbacteria bacterium]|nr:PHP domain-containing protein [Candidatus Daviesbacteria bacterium]